MEEVDGIITRTLKSMGCDFGRDFDKLDAEMMVSAVGQCITLIDPTIHVHKSLPPNMAARYRVGTSLAEAVKMLGYQEEVGYHTFLYSSVVEMRKLFMFLISKLPKRQMNMPKEFFSPQTLLKRLIRNRILESQNKPWMPSLFSQGIWQYCSFKAKKILIPFGCEEMMSVDRQVKYSSHHLPILCNQLHAIKDLYPSLLETNCLHLAMDQNKTKVFPSKYRYLDQSEMIVLKSYMGRTTSFESTTNLGSYPSIMLVTDKLPLSIEFPVQEVSLEHSHCQDQVIELDELEGRVKDKSVNVEYVESVLIQLKDSVEQVKKRTGSFLAEIAKRKEILKNKIKILGLAPSADENLRKLQEMAWKSKKQLEHQIQKWGEHQSKFNEKLDEISHRVKSDEIESKHVLEDIEDTKIKIRGLASQAHEKDVMQKQLIEEYKRMTDGLKRSEYTQRILEIVFSINKQNQEIEKVIVDTKSIQKEINALSGVAERTFIDADELIFKNARKDEYARKAYKLLASLRENCNSLIKVVERTGAMLKEISSLEEQIEQENRSNISENLDSILGDYYQIKQENQLLLQDLKSKTL